MRYPRNLGFAHAHMHMCAYMCDAQTLAHRQPLKHEEIKDASTDPHTCLLVEMRAH